MDYELVYLYPCLNLGIYNTNLLLKSKVGSVNVSLINLRFADTPCLANSSYCGLMAPTYYRAVQGYQLACGVHL